MSSLEKLGSLTPVRLEELQASGSDETIKQASLPPRIDGRPPSSSNAPPPAFETVVDQSPEGKDPSTKPPRLRTNRRRELPEMGRVPPSVHNGRDDSKTRNPSVVEPSEAVEKKLVRLYLPSIHVSTRTSD